MKAIVTAIAHSVPPDVYDNNWFTERIDTTDEWIQTRTGIKERHFAFEGGLTDILLPAAQEVLRQRGITADEIDCIIIATVTPDRIFPSSAAILQHKLGAKNAWGFDLAGACSGFLYALVTGAKMVEAGAAKKMLVLGGDKMSAILNFDDRTTCVLFGDGGGAVLLEPSESDEYGVVDHILRMDGAGEVHLHQKAGGSLRPPSIETVTNREHYVYQEGQAVFKSAVKGMADVSFEIMERNHLTADDVAWLVPHQANLRIIDATAERMGLSKEKVMINIERYGNTTAGTIPICLSELYSTNRVKKGDYLVLSSFGAGYTWGAVLLRWSLEQKDKA
ncbi:MAG: ketoacyl-ACP synthase III [Candidatus Kapabacteria bacterium]|nr:ketoacyl-ACP synthase III [Candidatus Kapabacteria bacterium]